MQEKKQSKAKIKIKDAAIVKMNGQGKFTLDFWKKEINCT